MTVADNVNILELVCIEIKAFQFGTFEDCFDGFNFVLAEVKSMQNSVLALEEIVDVLYLVVEQGEICQVTVGLEMWQSCNFALHAFKDGKFWQNCDRGQSVCACSTEEELFNSLWELLSFIEIMIVYKTQFGQVGEF